MIANNLNFAQDSSEVAPAPKEPKLSKSKLEKHQDELVYALTVYFGTRDKAKEEFAGSLGIETSTLNFRRLTMHDIVLAYEWLNSKPIII